MQNHLKPQILAQLNVITKTHKLRPKVDIDDSILIYRNHGDHFFGVHLYWDESYMDQLYFSPKWESLIKSIETYLTSITTITKIQTGTSDGHLFFYCNL